MSNPNSLCHKITNYIQEYCIISTVHGLNHTIKNHVAEKVLWIILVLISAIFGWNLSLITLNRYYTNPVVVSIERDRFSWTTFLPAVTICPVQIMNDTALNEFIETKGSKNRTHLRFFLISLFKANYTNFENVLDSDELTSDEYMPTIIKLQNKIKPDITVSGQYLSSTKWVHETITEMGLCYSFNSQLAVYNSPQYWINKTRNLLSERKIFDVHPLDGEAFVNIVNITLDHHVYIHGPYEVADIRSKFLFISQFSYVQVSLKALSIITSENAKELMVTQRKCRYYNESDLKHFPVYTYVLCRMECRILLTMKLCGCVPHFYKRLPGEKTCNSKGLHCLAQFKEQLISLEGLENDCKCPVNCEEVNYVTEDVDDREMYLGSILQYGIKYFPEMRLRRDVIFGFSDLLVYIGGVMGLFLGSSVLTVIELVYYFTLRLLWIIVRNKKMQ